MILAAWGLFYPTPSGPPDNFDFSRNFSWFSSGPIGYAFWPSPNDQKIFQERFFNYYHRFWRIDGGVPGLTQISPSLLIFLPSYLFRILGQHFDLALNTAFLLFLLGFFLFLSLKKTGLNAFGIFLGITFLAFSDVNVCGFLNSFYQEAGTFFFLGLFIITAVLFWRTPSLMNLSVLTVASFFLCTTKVAFTPSLPFLVAPLLFSAVKIRSLNRSLQRACIIVILLFATSVVPLTILLSSPRKIDHQANSYNFLFTGILPLLSSSSQSQFLKEIGLDPTYSRLSGKHAYMPDSEFYNSALTKHFGRSFHLKMIKTIILGHPYLLSKLLIHSISMSGLYPSLMFPSISNDNEPLPRSFGTHWSLLHKAFLKGFRGYVITLLLLLIVGAFLLKGIPPDHVFFFFTFSLGLFFSSLVQMVIGILGDGSMDIIKHLYFGNLCLDVALISIAVGLFLALPFIQGRKKHPVNNS